MAKLDRVIYRGNRQLLRLGGQIICGCIRDRLGRIYLGNIASRNRDT